jgi:undecaprenyl-diphosphatase
VLDFGAVWDIAVGFAVAFVTAVLVVRWVLSYISRNGYACSAGGESSSAALALGGALLGY